MEEDQELKHVCKFCSKSFSCGRSLGGHMRSHMINDITAQADGTKLTKKKLPSLVIINNGANNSTDATNGYGLRENPKKRWRLADHSSDQDSSILEKSCQECGKLFPSLKALFDHMKCHSTEREKFSINNIVVVNDNTEKKNNNSLEEEEEQDFWTSGDHNNQKLVMESQSDSETAAGAAPNRRKRSQRRTRYMMGTAANSSSLSFPNNNASSSVSEIEQEEEEVAICLMLLSRDVGQWGGGGLNSVIECSDNNSVFLENKIEEKNYVCNENETLMTKVESRKTEFSASEFSRKRSKKKKSQLDDESVVENSGVELGKRKFGDSFDLEASKNSDRNSRFECTTCNKIFHSYQALGGHRASHKKNKSCFATRIDSTENSIETEQLSPDPTPADDSQLIIKSIKDEISIVDYDNRAETKKSKGHECPICFKVFPSGQALGGHKRSHLVAGNEAKNTQNLPIKEPIPAPIRDFLDLNLPAPVEEDTNGLLGFNQWWIASNRKHESLLGLISN